MSNTQSYIPFLKLKQNEIMALKELHPTSITKVSPFFDFPMGKDDTPSKFRDYSKAKAKQIKAHLGENFQCYIDDYDTTEFEIEGSHSYSILLQEFSTCSVIPVTGLDRTEEHTQSIIESVRSNLISSNVFAYRIQLEDIQSYEAIEDEIEESTAELSEVFNFIDLVIDLRVSLNHDVNATAANATTFIRSFVNNFPVRKVIIAGSSISSIITEICPPQTNRENKRKEVEIFLAIRNSYQLEPELIFADYTVISPEYSDTTMEPELIRSVMTSKLIYSHDHSHTIWRGTAMRMEGEKQYNEHAQALISSPIYRGAQFSWADGEFFIKSSLLSGFSAGSMLKHTINAHIEFMIKIGI